MARLGCELAVWDGAGIGMQIRPRTHTVVILARDHNASILNPTFLAVQHIVPEHWKTTEALSTQPFSRVAYENGLEIQADPTRLHVLDKNPGTKPSEAQAHVIASKYLEALPHVPYRAVGLNALSFVDQPDAPAFLIDRFLKDGEWKSSDPILTGANLKLSYQLEDARLTVTVNSGKTPEGTIGIFLEANYHFDLEDQSPLKTALGVLATYPERLGHFEGTAMRILG